MNTPQHDTHTTATLLIVEDDDTLRNTLAHALEHEYTVLTAANGEEGLQVLGQWAQIDLMMTDINMPKMGGLELITKVKQAYPALPIIVMTAFVTPKIQSEVERRRIITYIEKPFQFEQLLQKTEEVLTKNTGRKGFRGDVLVFGLVDIIQLYCFSKVQAALTVKRETTQGEEQGTIYFQNGGIIGAVCGKIEGERAFHYIMGWKKGGFNTRYGVMMKERNITTNWEALLMQTMQLVDEQELANELSANTASSPADEPESAAADISYRENEIEDSGGYDEQQRAALKQVLAALQRQTPEIIHSILAEVDGKPLVSETQTAFQHQKLHTSIAPLLAFYAHVRQEVDMGQIEETIVFTQSGFLLFSQIPELHLVFGNIVHGKENLGMLRWDVRQTIEQIRAIASKGGVTEGAASSSASSRDGV